MATVSEEHQLTTTCTEMLTLLEARQPGFRALHQSPSPQVLLVSAENNSHALGIRLVEFFLVTRSVPAMVVYSDFPSRRCFSSCVPCVPKSLGISCALPSHIDSARRTATVIADLPSPERPVVFAGGYALRKIQETGPEELFKVCITPADLLELLPHHASPNAMPPRAILTQPMQ